MPDIEPGLPDEPELDAERMATMTVGVAAASHRALRAGAIAPDFRLCDYGGDPHTLGQVTADGPAVIHFYRGSWCTHCHDSLAELAGAYEGIRASGGQVIAIAPPASARLALSAQAHAARLPFPTLIDEKMKVAIAYGLAYSLPVELRPVYLERGYEPPHNPKAGEWLVPVPATYLVHPNGTIVLSEVDVDYRNQLHSAPIVAALGGMRRRGSKRGAAP